VTSYRDAPANAYHALAAAAGARFNTHASFRPTRFVWNRGLALLCDHNGGSSFVRAQRGGGRPALRFDPSAYADIGDGDLVWVRLSALQQFYVEVLPRVTASFALVTGDEDLAIPSGFEFSGEILGNRNVICWFTQNADGTDASGKVFPIPIGIDFHTISNQRKWRHWQATPRRQEAELERVRATMSANGDRLVRAHADFHFNMREDEFAGESRFEVRNTLHENPNVDFQPRRVSRLELWRERARYAFAISPHGHGLDCHRSWESLALSTIPIVKRSALDPLYDGLPVVIVDDWREITSDNLSRWHSDLHGAFADAEVQARLTNDYWIARMRRIFSEQREKAGKISH
jgi:hypothetical protein